MRCCSSAGTVAVLGAGATFLDSLSDYTPDQMADSLEQLATLHAATWMGAVAQAKWLSPRLESTGPTPARCRSSACAALTLWPHPERAARVRRPLRGCE